jgi:hypothetical protein
MLSGMNERTIAASISFLIFSSNEMFDAGQNIKCAIKT